VQHVLVDGWLQTQEVKLSAADLQEISRLLDTND
jgi:hypothetical protein